MSPDEKFLFVADPYNNGTTIYEVGTWTQLYRFDMDSFAIFELAGEICVLINYLVKFYKCTDPP